MGSGFFGKFNQAARFSASLPFGPGKVAGGAGQRDVWSGFGSRGVVGSRARERLRRGRGVGGAHGGGAGAGPAVGGEVGFFGGWSPCCAFRRIHAMPSAHSCRAFGVSLRFDSGWWRGAVGVRGVFGDAVGYGLAGRGTPAAWQGSGRSPRRGSGRGPAEWGGVGFFWWIDPMLRLLALPCCFFGAPLPSRCWRGAEGGVLVGVGMGGGGGFWLWKRWRCSMRPFCRPRSQGSMDVLSVLSGEGGDRCSGSQCFSGKRGRCGGMDQGERSAAMDPEGSPRSDAPG